jgi:hypothetical protein
MARTDAQHEAAAEKRFAKEAAAVAKKEAAADVREVADEEQAPATAPSDAAEIKAAAKGAFKSSADYLNRGSWSPTLRPPRQGRNVGGLLTGLALYVVASTYIRYGPEGWKGWLRAKFLNQPWDKGGQGSNSTKKPTKEAA